MSDKETECFVCGNAVSFDYSFGNPDSAVSGKVCADFGSEYDGFYGQIYVCDECFSERIGRVIDLKNYLDDYEEEIDAAEAAVIELAEKVVDTAMAKFHHPSNGNFWDSIRKRYWS